MKFEEIEVNQYINWKHESRFKNWDTYGKILHKTDEDFSVLTFDDGKEYLYTIDTSFLSEFVLSNNDVVDIYIKDNIEKLKRKKDIYLKDNIEKLKRMKDKHLENIKIIENNILNFESWLI